MRNDRVERLNKIGFNWNPRESEWQETFKKLEEFISIHNKYPTRKENYTLNIFIKNVRKRKGSLSLERISLLESLKNWKW